MAKLISMQEMAENENQKELQKKFYELALSDKYKAENLFETYENFIQHLVSIENLTEGKIDKALNNFPNSVIEKMKRRSLSIEALSSNDISIFLIAHELSDLQQILILKWYLINLKFTHYTHYPIRFFSNKYDNDIELLYKKLLAKVNPTNDIFNFEKIKNELNTKNNNEKKVHLIEVITAYKQQFNALYDQCEANFLQKCELELEKIKQIENLEKQSNSPEIVPSSVTQIKKIIWKGTQKQLAELFIELKKKGWIDHHENGAIKSCFAETKSIDQYLKPFHDPKSKVKEPTYENVYTTEYIPSFDSVTPNKGS